MSDLQVLFLVLILLYAWECACWLRTGSVAFRTWLGRGWRVVYPGVLLGNQSGGFVFAAPLPPLGTLLTASAFPLALSPEGVFSAVGSATGQTGSLLRFEEMRGIEHKGLDVLVNGETLLRAPSRTYAAWLATQLKELRDTAPARRGDAFERLLAATLDLRAVHRRWQGFQARTRTLRLLTNFFWAFLFCLSPTLIWVVGFRLLWPGLLCALVALAVGTYLSFRRAHLLFYPQADDERFTHSLTVLLSPATGIRALDILSRPLLETFHPLALARAFCAEPKFRELARATLLDLRHPRTSGDRAQNTPGWNAERHTRSLWLSFVERFLAGNGVDPADLTRPPARLDATCKSYCPRCQTQFVTVAGECPDCGGIALASFDP